MKSLSFLNMINDHAYELLWNYSLTFYEENIPLDVSNL